MVPIQTVAQIVIVKLQSVTSPSNYLAIRGGNVHGKVGVCITTIPTIVIGIISDETIL